MVATRDAYAFCEKLAREHYENFPVASFLLPARMRPHIAAIYAYARTADDIADEPGRQPEERLRLLSELRERLYSTDSTDPRLARRSFSERGTHEPTDLRTYGPIFIALRDTIDRCDLPVQLLDDLLSAFEQDVTVHRYETWAAVHDYCRRSANPVGRLVLRVAGVRNDAADRASDAVCTALQLANFWQDFGRDWRNGRLYVPAEEWTRHGASEGDLNGERMTKAWRGAMRACVAHTRTQFESGRPVTDYVDGRLRFELRATWLGGVRILEKIEALGYDTLHRRPQLRTSDAAGILARAILWRLGKHSTEH